MPISPRFRGALWVIAIAMQITLLIGWPTQLMAQEKPKFRGDTLTTFELGPVEAGQYKLKATLFSMEPGAEAPYHLHKGPGIRYVLEGAITISWKDKGANTFGAGSTYTEGPGENHPPGVIAAKNLTSVTTKVLIIELLPSSSGPIN
jgi:quercetin dioxygenase-like cupin family protein